MKKTLFLTMEFPPVFGGVSTYYENICDLLPKDSIVVLTQPHKEAERFDRQKPYTIYREELFWKNRFLWPRWGKTLSTILKVIKKEKIECIVAGQILPLGTVAYITKLKTNIPYYIFSHGMDVTILRGRKKIIAAKIIREARGVIVNSNFTKHCIENFRYHPMHIHTVYPCPTPLPHPSPVDVVRIKNAYHLHNKKILLTVGRIIERKGYDMVLRAMQNILKKIPDCVYIIAGSGEHQKILEEYVREKKLRQNVIFTGDVSRAELSALYELCDVFIMPCRELVNGDVEGFGIVFLEANAFGKPVIAGRSGGAPEAVIHERTGILVDPKSISEIENAAVHLLGNAQYSQKLGMQGMDRVHSKFLWDTQAKKIQDILS